MRFAYADPPYYGLAKKFYGHLHPQAGDYDRLETHAALIERLCAEYPDGWAMSLHTPSLRHILPLCPDDVRVGSWVKPFCSFKPGVPRAYAWEPVIFRGGRPLGRSDRTVRDYCAAPITLRRGFTGAKPAALLHWICEWLGVQAGDAVDDLFPGSGGCAIAIADYLSAKAGAMPASGLFEATS